MPVPLSSDFPHSPFSSQGVSDLEALCVWSTAPHFSTPHLDGLFTFPCTLLTSTAAALLVKIYLPASLIPSGLMVGRGAINPKFPK